ncbi:lysoplasmalogenase [Sphingomonas sp. MG17]|uniref:Lysoplasmalogenase n=1 Tax=Sphingomonas tagetis TaxID=2949092 RepID=A0A9X2KMK3_9SPHN|nr:lysoplasmalogenase family protein [Sphingomonas tagetis]MCP3731787.1 lysoplasmalogenase [Sphingomonas tagetis]
MRWLFWVAVLTGASNSLSAWGLVEAGTWQAAWKTSGVALLAAWAATQARNADGGLIAGVLALGALGDLLLETHGFAAGGAAFAAGHVAAIWLYLRNRRAAPSMSQWLLGWALVPLVTLIALLFSRGDKGVAVYAVLLGAMAATAWISRFPRYRVGIGAMLFVASDLLIFARMGPLAGSAVPGMLIWPLYFAGQALVAWGVVQALSSDQRVS